ncbi:unnamed protein product [Ilex paraguariensis]|uniref:Uncharacterized protein n=1 Tax=Ilex paraguariensis TaxID=185542 RepID=A0ABC8TKL4_9AQUA
MQLKLKRILAQMREDARAASSDADGADSEQVMARSEELRGTGHQLSILPLAVDRRSDVLKSGGRGESQLALSSVK